MLTLALRGRGCHLIERGQIWLIGEGRESDLGEEYSRMGDGRSEAGSGREELGSLAADGQKQRERRGELSVSR